MPTWLKVLAASLLVGAIVSGCGGTKPPFQTVTLAGTVKFEGEPIKSGAISFTPMDGKVPSSGGVILNGKYLVQVPVGPKRVAITAARPTGRKVKAYDTPDSPETEIMEELLPSKYNAESTLEIDVRASKSDQNFELAK